MNYWKQKRDEIKCGLTGHNIDKLAEQTEYGFSIEWQCTADAEYLADVIYEEGFLANTMQIDTDWPFELEIRTNSWPMKFAVDRDKFQVLTRQVAKKILTGVLPAPPEVVDWCRTIKGFND